MQSLKINLDITGSNVKEIYKILKGLEQAYETIKNAITDFWPLLKPFWSQYSSTLVKTNTHTYEKTTDIDSDLKHLLLKIRSNRKSHA